MIAAWMVYCIAVGVILCLAGWALERALYFAGRPTRWAWSVALAGTLLVPVVALLRPLAAGTITVPLPMPAGFGNATAPGNLVAQSDPSALAPGISWTDLDGPLAWGWGIGSAVLLLVFGGSAARLAVLRRRWRPMSVDGRPVLVADDVGPAVAGLWPPRVVLPAWALTLTPQQQGLILAHEEEHVRARDPWLLFAATLVLILAPWNPASWWLVRRLRLAVELDCDARVVHHGNSVADYGELLLQAVQRRAHLPRAAAALGETRSLLELRIRRLSSRLPRRRWLGAAAALLIATTTFIGACETPRPVSPEEASPAVTGTTPATIALRGRAVAESLMAESLRPWIAENLRRYYPDLLHQPDGPPLDVWFAHDASLDVQAAARIPGTSRTIEGADIGALFSRFRPGYDAWGVVDRLALKGLVRDNVRVIWVHVGALDADVGTPSAGPGVPGSNAEGPPEFQSGPRFQLPDLLRHAGFTGRVVVHVMIDSNGRADLATLRVIGSPHPAFDQAVRTFLRDARFLPGRAGGRAVRAMIELPITFTSPEGQPPIRPAH